MVNVLHENENDWEKSVFDVLGAVLGYQCGEVPFAVEETSWWAYDQDLHHIL